MNTTERGISFITRQRSDQLCAKQLQVTTDSDVAFASGLAHCEGTSAGPLDLCLTVGLRKIHG